MNDLDKYWKALGNGDHDTCISIEQKYGLFGYSPEVVTRELKAMIGDENERV